jgi:hypothetical protein
MARRKKGTTQASELTEIFFLACKFRRAGIPRDKLDSGVRSANFAIAIIPAWAGSFAQRVKQSSVQWSASSLSVKEDD